MIAQNYTRKGKTSKYCYLLKIAHKYTRKVKAPILLSTDESKYRTRKAKISDLLFIGDSTELSHYRLKPGNIGIY